MKEEVSTTGQGIPDDIRKTFASLRKQGEIGAWGPLVTVSQTEVDLFTRLTGDTNPIHQVGGEIFPQPILPGLLILAFLPKLLHGGVASLFPGYPVTLKRSTCDYVRAVPVGQHIKMRCRPDMLLGDRLSPLVTFEFEVVVVNAANEKPVASGTIELRILSRQRDVQTVRGP